MQSSRQQNEEAFIPINSTGCRFNTVNCYVPACEMGQFEFLFQHILPERDGKKNYLRTKSMGGNEENYGVRITLKVSAFVFVLNFVSTYSRLFVRIVKSNCKHISVRFSTCRCNLISA